MPTLSVPFIEIGGYRVGPGYPCFIIAEAGINHNGSIDLATQLVDAACQVKAHAIKFQTFRANTLVTPHARKAKYQNVGDDDHEPQYQMLKRLELSPDAHRRLFDYCYERGILFLSTPFDEQCVDFLDELGVAAFKVSSGEITNHRLLRHIAKKHQPVILSTGMSRLGEIEDALAVFEAENHRNVALLHTVSSYPAPAEDVNLRAIDTLMYAFRRPVGYSDHTLGNDVPLAAAARGACIIEKHLTLDRRLPGPDHAASAEPAEFAALVRGIRTIESALGDGIKSPQPSEADVASVARRSIVLTYDLPAGTILTEQHLDFRRPGTGLPPHLASMVVGRKLRTSVTAGTLLTLEMLS